MKKHLQFALAIASLFCGRAIAQTPFPTKAYVDINNIKAMVLVHGDMWWDPADQMAHCNFPAASGKNINFAGALWMSGYDGSSQLHVASQTYRQDGNDYWPGPLDAADTLTYATSQKWAKIWKLNRTDIDAFRALTTHTAATTPAAILTWPAKGNADAAGAGGAPLTITENTAPFIDLNGNGIYEPLQGEYPDVTGDQVLWWIFSDNGPAHNNSNGKPLGVQIQAMAYAYSRGTLIDNVVYYDYKITNKSANTYSNFRLGQWDDIDLGYYLDDFIGFDSSHRMGIAYNGAIDDGAAGGHPANSYGTSMPIVGLSMIVLPGDDQTTNTKVPAGSFMYYNNDASAYGNPASGAEYDKYLRSTFRDGSHLTNDFTVAGTPTTGYGTGPATNYVFNGDPAINTQWSECNSTNTPGDRRFIITSNDFTLSAGGSQRVVMALMTTDLAPSNACPEAGFSIIKNIADTAWSIFDHPYYPAAVAAPVVHTIGVYPNPAHDKLFIKDGSNYGGEIQLSVFNTLGQRMNILYNKNERSIDIGAIPAGAYYLVYEAGGQRTATTFIKQ